MRGSRRGRLPCALRRTKRQGLQARWESSKSRGRFPYSDFVQPKADERRRLRKTPDEARLPPAPRRILPKKVLRSLAMPALLPQPTVALSLSTPTLFRQLLPLAASYRMPAAWEADLDQIAASEDWSTQQEIAWRLPSGAAALADLAAAASRAQRLGLALRTVACTGPLTTALGDALLKAGVSAVCTQENDRAPRRIRFGLWEFPAGVRVALDAGAWRSWRQRRALSAALVRLAAQGGLMRVECTAAADADGDAVRRRFERVLRLLCRRRDLGHVCVTPLSTVAAQLSHRPRAAAAQSILRVYAA